MISDKKMKFLFAGGGTGGHLFPAVAVAERIKIEFPNADILFIGTKNKIEARVVPSLGYDFKSIWIRGFARKITLQNLLFPIRLLAATLQSITINKKFRPDVAIGSGGYVSGPALFGSKKVGAKIFLLEQNSFPGKTTLMLSKDAEKVFVSFEDSVKYFKEKEKVIVSGNPIRVSLKLIDQQKAKANLGNVEGERTLLILGGSLGAKSINEEIARILPRLLDENIFVVWQTGKLYYDQYKNLNGKGCVVKEFIDNMDVAFSAADLICSRAGATTIAEITALGLAAIFVPSPNVAANHQYFNAKSLADKNAALLVEDKNISADLLSAISRTIKDADKLEALKNSAKKLAKLNASNIIINEIWKAINNG